MHWADVLNEALRLPGLIHSRAVPFGIDDGKERIWRVPKTTERDARAWVLSASSDDGLEAMWTWTAFPDTRAVECQGSLHSVGAPVRGIDRLLTLDMQLELGAAWGEPRVRSLNGARPVANHFPPHDFRVHDRQLVRLQHVHEPLVLMSREDGRSSGRDLPCVIVTSERDDRGLAIFLEWSGLWFISLEQAPMAGDHVGSDPPWYLSLRAGMWGLSLDLAPGQELPLARALVLGFDGDLDAGGNALRRHIRRHVAPRIAGTEALPALSFNHWFAFENDFSARQLRPAVRAAAEAGLEYFVIDAGWFAGGFRTGLGNWDRVDTDKFPSGIADFSRYAQSHGLGFGLWFEPEFAHKSSDLYRDRPHWFLPAPPAASPWRSPANSHYAPSGGGFRLLDFGQPDVREYWITRIVRAYREWGVRWIRWDFNAQPRPYWEADPRAEAGWRQIRHITGLYAVLDTILDECPDLFVEQCATGGYRIDLGTIRRGHAFWMNDQTQHSDVVRSLQHALNTVLPGIYANTNLCQPRHDFSDYDYLSHAGGSFGYSGRLWEAPKADFQRYRHHVQMFKGYRPLLQGDYERAAGDPAARTDYSKATWSQADRAVTMEFNIDGRVRSARLLQA